MENRNENIQELDLEQMEKISGGNEGGFVYRCNKCPATFKEYSKFVAHMQECNPKTPKFARQTHEQ